MQKWQRNALLGLAGVGVADTGYLLVAHSVSRSVACPETGLIRCDAVLESPFATVLGLPLAAFGILAYLAVIVLVFLPQFFFWLRALTAAMALTGGFLLYLMVGTLHALCLYCLLSLVLSASLAAIAHVEDRRLAGGQSAVAGVGLGALMAVAIGLAPAGSVAVAPGGRVGVPLATEHFVVSTESGPSELALADHLAARGAAVYGGFRCPHCHRQKQLFGLAAMHRLKYVECDPRSPEADRAACDQAGVKSYPTWVIGGVHVEGERNLEEIAAATGYSGPQNFLRVILK
jgi:uncharacterized membrane protein/glutaredoxin